MTRFQTWILKQIQPFLQALPSTSNEVWTAVCSDGGKLMNDHEITILLKLYHVDRGMGSFGQVGEICSFDDHR